MQEVTRRTVLRLGAGLAGACALDPIWQSGLATASGVSFIGGHDVEAWHEKLPRELAWLAT